MLKCHSKIFQDKYLPLSAQSHIFRSIYIGNPSASARIRDPYARPQMRHLSPSAAMLMQRIVHLSHSPHLLPHVRELNVEALSLGLMGNSLEHSALQHLHTLVSLPSLRHLTFRDCWEGAALQSVIANCSASLESITFWCCDVDDHWVSLPTSAVSTRLRIRNLTIFESPTISDALIHPAFPLDFSALTHLQLSQSLRPAVRSFLHLTGATITYLEIFEFNFTVDLDLSMMTALTDISLLHPVLPVLMRLPAGNRLTHLFIRMGDFDMKTFASEVPTSVTVRNDVGTRIDDEDSLTGPNSPLPITYASALEAFVFRAFPALRRVEIEVLTMGRNPNVVGIIQGSLPRLHEKGILFVEHYD
ncbi:hypothetical protein C8R43DRAFT_1201096 [Mycena crocata]|nr:hypothetical protein C8R43DRAFT_1201096 [Mycena crocata]